MAYEYNESGIESSYDIHDWSNNVIISDTRMDSIDKGIVNLYNAIFGNEAENINGIIHHFEGKNNTVNNIIGTRPNDNNDTIFDNIKKLWHNITKEENTDETRTPYGKIVDLQNGLGTLNIDSSTTAFGHIKTLETNLGNRNNNDSAFNEIETAKSRLTTLETKLGPAPQDEEDKNTAFDRVATLETNLETLTTNIQPDLKIIENSNIISIDDAAPLDAEGLVVNIEPVQAGSGDPSPDNVRPISGWTGSKVTRTGKNLLKNNGTSGSNGGITWTMNSDGSIALSGTAGDNYVHININTLREPQILANGTVQLVCSAAESFNPEIGGINFQNDIYIDGTYSSTIQNGTPTRQYSGGEISVGVSQLRIAPNTVIPNGTVYYPLITIGSTIDEWIPYQGQTYDIAFPSGAGTVYGGTLDVVNGMLTVDRAMVDLGTLTWNGNKRFTAIVQDSLKLVGNGTVPNWVCSALMIATPNAVYGNTADYAVSYYGPSLIQARINDITDAATFKTAMSGVQLVYELATPITYQLTPPAITLLRGNNNIWADCGNITMKYWQDKVLYENFYTKTQTNNLLLPLNEITTLDNRMVALEETLEDTVREETDKALLKTTFKLTLPYLTASILTKEKEYKIRLLDINYPIGSIYMTLNNADPKNILGGKWIPISQGRVLLGAGNNISDGTTTKSFTVGSTGGEYNHKLIIDEMPTHNHNVYYSNTKGTETGSVLTRATKTKRKTASDVVINKGGNTGHNNIQPYLVCNIWQRVIEDIHDVMRAMDSGTYTYLFNVDNEVPLIIDDNTTIIMIIDQIDTENNYVYFRQKYTEGMEPCSNSEINDKLTSFQNSIPSDVKLALVGNPTLPTETTLDDVEVWATSNQGDTEAQHYLLPRICLKTIDMGISSNIVDAEDSGHSF